LLQDFVEPLREKVLWGPLVPYNITGQMNRHPRAAIKFLDGADNKNYVKFFDEIVTDV
jgi:4-hydroxy 2-oxovalerate aldolase